MKYRLLMAVTQGLAVWYRAMASCEVKGVLRLMRTRIMRVVWVVAVCIARSLLKWSKMRPLFFG